MRHVILNPIKVKKLIESAGINTKVHPDISGTTDEVQSELVETTNCDWDNMYSSEQASQERTNIDTFAKYNFSTDCYKQKDEVKISKKETFVVVKMIDTKNNITDLDNLYKVDKQLRHRRLRKKNKVGYIRGSNRFKYARYNLDNTDKIVGIANNQFPIRKHKGFNQKCIGYIDISESSTINAENESDGLYAEITCGRSTLQMVFTILLVLTILMLPKAHNWNKNIEVDTSNIPTWTELKNIFNNEQLILHHNEDAVYNYDTKQAEIELTSDPAETIEFKLSVYVEINNQQQLIYKSKQLRAGENIAQLPIPGVENMDPGNYFCTIICEVYKDLPFNLTPHIGTLESHFTLWI